MSDGDLLDANAQYSVETYLGKTGSGEIKYADPVTLDVRATYGVQLIRNADAEQVPSMSTISSAGLDHVDTIVPNSRVTLTARRIAGEWVAVTDAKPTTVITVKVSVGGDDIGDGLDRVKAWLV
jgi:hypothetical protein